MLRVLVVLLLVGYVASAAVMLGVRYWILPHIDRWRPEIEVQLSKVLSANVEIGQIKASWAGLHPTLTINNLVVSDSTGKALLKVPSLFAVAAWSSLAHLELKFIDLRIEGLALSATKRRDGVIELMGFELDAFKPELLERPAEIPALKWMLNQQLVQLKDASFSWLDESREAPELQVSQIQATIHNGLFAHEMTLTAQAPTALGGQLTLSMRADQAFASYVPALAKKIELYGEFNNVTPERWRPWFEVPVISGKFSARAWVGVLNGQLAKTTIDVAGIHAGGGLDESAWRADHLSVRVEGRVADLLPDLPAALLVRNNEKSDVDVTASLQQMEIVGPMFEPSPLKLGQVDAVVTLRSLSGGELTADVKKLAISNSDTNLNLYGQWRAGGAAAMGMVDFKGIINRFDAKALYRYLPAMTDPNARNWLQQSVVSGSFTGADVTLRGDLAYFPFNDCGSSGDFVIEGRLKDLTLDYAPKSLGGDVWPAIEQANGTFRYSKLGLDVNVSSAYLYSSGQEKIKVKHLSASIPDMYYDPKLSLSVQTEGYGQAYIGALTGTPIAEKYGEGFSDIAIKGVIEAPFDLLIDLAYPDKTKVDGSLSVQNATVRLANDLPDIEDVSGRVDYSGDLIHFHEVQARLLDGRVKLDGKFDQKDGVVQISGVLGAAWIMQAAKLPSDDLIKGSLQYSGRMKLNANGGIEASINSSLKGLAINLPSPLGKIADQNMPLNIRFNGSRKAKDTSKSLAVSYGPSLRAQFERTNDKMNTSVFNKGVISFANSVGLPEDGLLIDATLPNFDWDTWKDLVHLFSKQSESNRTRVLQVLPTLTRSHLKANQLVWSDITLTDVDLSLTRDAPSRWDAMLKSRETDGKISWQPAPGGGAGQVTAYLSRLALGSAAEVIKTDADDDAGLGSNDTAMVDGEDWSDIPSIDLNIEELTLYGNKLGKFRFKGVNLDSGKRWNIEQLQVTNPFASLDATGSLRLTTVNRGVSLTSKIDIKDLGKLSAFMGYPDRVKDGAGTIVADIEWDNFPWVFDYGSMSGTAQVDMKNGVFEHLNSRSARLLELLSVQSLQRLFSLNFKAGTVFENGYPWNAISGKFLITHGVVSTEDLTIAAPVANILLTGKSDLNRRIWDMQADVKPIFDMSGTAVATGFVVNPLVGVGALVTQFLLRNPIEKALTARYKVTGPWDDPKLDPIIAAQPADRASTPSH